MATDFVDLEFPRRLALGAVSEPGWSTSLAETFGGYESANQNWANAKHRFDVSLAIRTEADYKLARAHFHSVRGRGKVFPFTDPLDYKCQAVEGVLIDNGDSPAGDYQLVKVYGSGADGWQRWITRPKSGVVVYRTRAGVVSVATATVSLTTGRVTVTGHVGGDTYTWSGQFFVPCRYGSDRFPAAAVDRSPEGGDLLVRVESLEIVEARERNADGDI
jgi:uncharacterized protein (TIGR02217 family)